MVLKIKTGSTILNCIVGDGFPVGKVLNIVGDKSSGKSFLACEIINSAVNQYGKKLKWFYDDCEGGFNFNTKEIYGFDIMKDEFMASDSVEELGIKINEELDKLKNNEMLVYVVDSLDGLSSLAEKERDIKRTKSFKQGSKITGSYGLEKQSYISEFFRLNINKIKNKNCLLIIISQVRENIGVMFGSKYKRTGGKSLDHYAHTVLWLAEVEKIKKKNRVTGVTVKAKTTKSKTTRPFREGFIDILFDYGVDEVGSNLDFLYDLRTDRGKRKKTEKTLSWKIKEKDKKNFEDREKLIAFIEDNDLEIKLSGKVKEKWELIEESIRPKRKKKFNNKQGKNE